MAAAVIAEGQVKRESMTPFFLVSLSAGRDDDGVLYGSIQGRNDPPRASTVFFSSGSAGVGARSQGRVFARDDERRAAEEEKEEAAVKYFEPRKASCTFNQSSR